jgi:hypothetical protein
MRRALLPMLILLAACRSPSPQPAVPSDPATQRRDVRTHHLSLEGGFFTVDVLVPLALPPPRPAVISLVGEEDAMLDAGVAVVKYRTHWELLRGLAPEKTPAPDPPPAPTKTYGRWLLASPSPRTVGQGYFALIAGNAEGTIPKIVDAIAALPDVDASRLGIVGTSTNGFVVLQALAAEPRLTAGVAFAACGDYHAFLRRSPLGMDGAPLDLDPAYDRWLREREPIRHPGRLVHAALLMLNGGEDRTVPVTCAVDTARVLRAAYRRAGASRRFRFVLLEGVGHDVSVRARSEMLAWWRRWLLAQSR